ncbi:MAG TPA: 3-deoxy-D-manno-octulosonic acid transferase [Pirellulales bacterium]|nr:3-deoxy-D-manno-octulosonic acid transferase [Pirellulales bacterium]
MRYLFNLLYLALIALASPKLVYRALAHGKYRCGWLEKLFGLVPLRTGDAPCVWFHAVSVGEVNLLAPLLAEIARRQPGWRCVVSTTTATGFATAQKKYPNLTVFYCPLDFTWAVAAAMRRIRPTCLVLAELELWPNLIAAARRSDARVAVVNGRLSERSYKGYRRMRRLIARTLSQLDLLAVQNEEYAERFLMLGAKPGTVCVTGSMKFDGAQTDRKNAATVRMRHLAGIADGDVVFLAGSTQQGEEEATLSAYGALAGEHPALRLVVVPRHPERFDAVAALLDRSGFDWQRRSRLDQEGARPTARVLLVDTIGELGAWWGTADIAFVGGSLGNRGGQNMIEPAAYGAAVCFGTNTRNFRDIVEQMLSARASAVVADAGELTEFVRRCLTDRSFADALGHRARRIVLSQLGATDRTFELLSPLVDICCSHSACAA